MTRAPVRRAVGAAVTLLVIFAVIFALLELAPGDPMAQLPASIPADVRAEMRAALGMGQPAPQRFAAWLWQMLVVEPRITLAAAFDIDASVDTVRILSWQTRGPVMDLVAQRLPQTLIVVGLAYVIGLGAAILLGVLSAARRGGPLDRAGTAVAALGYALPPFFTAAVLIYVFSIRLEWLPSVYDTTLRMGGWSGAVEQMRQMILPVAVLSLQTMAQITRYLRAAMLEVLGQDFIRCARAKGVAERRVLTRHALRNALVPVVAVIGMGVPQVFAGAIITEQVFGVNGIGQLLISALKAGDLPVVQTVTALIAVLIVLANIGADVALSLLDPRVRHD